MRLEAIVGEGKRISADGQIHEVIDPIRVGLLGAREFCLVADDGHIGFRQNTPSFVCDCAGDAAECLLRPSVGGESNEHPQRRH